MSSLSVTLSPSEAWDRHQRNAFSESPDDSVDIAIVGGGLAGLCLAFELRRRAPDMNLVLLEASDRLGGKIQTEIVKTDAGHFLVEAGPDALLTQKPWGRQLVEALGLSDQLLPINRPPRPVSILRADRPVDLPEGIALIAPTKFWPFVRSPLFSPLGKLRIGLDLALPARRGDADESVGNFVRRRLGNQALERLAEPLIAGIYSADPDRLSLRATFPQYHALERQSGSIARGLRAARNATSTTEHAPAFFTLRDGMRTLVDALALETASVTRRCSRVTQLARDAAGAFTLQMAGGESISAKRVALATPAIEAARLLQAVAPDAAARLARLRTTNTGTMSMAYPTTAIRRPLAGYGLVIPRAAGRPINAITVASAKFAHRAPAGWSLFRVFFGGARSPATFLADDEGVSGIVREQLRDLLGIEEAPAFHRIYRWRDASPQYDVGHLDLVASIETRLPSGLFVTGSPFRGVGIPDIARAATDIAERVRATACTEGSG